MRFRLRDGWLVGVPAVLVMGAMLWPLVYALWLSFTPSELLVLPRSEWSLRWYETFFADRRWIQALFNSLQVGALCGGLSVLLGFGAAWALAGRRNRLDRILSLAFLTPLFLPAIVIGITFLPAARAVGLWGTHFSIAAAHSLWGVPMVFLAAKIALEALDPDLDAAARGLGAGLLARIALVRLPLIGPSLAVGGLMAVIISLNELVMALFLSTPETETLPRVIWPSLRYTLSPVVAAASSFFVLISGLALLLAAWGLRLRNRKFN